MHLSVPAQALLHAINASHLAVCQMSLPITGKHHIVCDLCMFCCRPFFLALTALGVAAAAQRHGFSCRTLVLSLAAWALANSDVAVRQYNEGAPSCCCHSVADR